jgi:hypothetical protein
MLSFISPKFPYHEQFRRISASLIRRTRLNRSTRISGFLLLALLALSLLVPCLPASVKADISYDNTYANAVTGNNSYNGSSPTYTGGSNGPTKTITAAIANTNPDGTVHVASGTYTERIHLGNNMNLVGAGALTTIIDGNHTGVVVDVSSAPLQTNTISGFTITGGYPAGSVCGGGIYISSSHIVTINDCAIVNNYKASGLTAKPNRGGGICNDNGKVYMNRCTISGNQAGYQGGGIANLCDFEASGFGKMWLTNCTISGNSVTHVNGVGGGLYNDHLADVTLLNVTIANNIATGGNSCGGGFSNSSLSSMYFKNCIVANNTAVGHPQYSNGYSGLGSGVHSQGYNLDSQNSCYFDQPTDQINTDPQLGVLQNNGGPTSTHAITIASPAYNRGDRSAAPATDQRGAARPAGATCSIGAFEPETNNISVNPANIDFGSITVGTASSQQTVTITDNGTGPLTVGAIALTGANADQFRIVSDNASNQVIPAGGVRMVVLIFTPSSTGLKIASLSIPHNPGMPVVVALSGTGTATPQLLQRSASISTSLGNVGFFINNGSISGLTAISPANMSCAPSGYSFPYGFFSFIITNLPAGGSVQVVLRFPNPLPSGVKYFKCLNGSLVDCTPIMSRPDTNTIVLTLIDGGFGDADRTANGIIIDPGAACFPLNTPTSHQSSLPATPQATVSPANIAIKSASLSAAKVTPGTPVTITANVANTGTVNGSSSVRVYVNGSEEAVQGVTVNSGGTSTVSFTVSRNEPGTYSVYVGGTQAGSFTVDEYFDPNTILFISSALVLFSFVLGVIYITKRRQAY